MKKIKIALKGTPHDYPSSLVPILIHHLGYEIFWVLEPQADLVIEGPFAEKRSKFERLVPKPLRKWMIDTEKSNRRIIDNQHNVRLFQTSENIRPNLVSCHFALSFDLGITSSNHFRFPYWMEMVDWSTSGIKGNQNPRYGKLLNLDQMLKPLGSSFLLRERKASLITSHLLEPRKTLYSVVKQVLPVEGYGSYFNPTIKNHHQSDFIKFNVLQNYSFNLCPENALYPGYYTEKIPEAFLAGCLPITWVDENVSVDFNPKAMINLAPMYWNNFKDLTDILQDESRLKAYADEPLMLTRPDLEPLLNFLREICRQATS